MWLSKYTAACDALPHMSSLEEFCSQVGKFIGSQTVSNSTVSEHPALLRTVGVFIIFSVLIGFH
jgi:hypothetical protein